jgi:predicted phage gp36 major capsid-like protein
MATATGAGTRVLLYGDFSQNYVVDRWPGFTLFEPMLKGTGASANLPTGQSGWFYVWRTGLGQSSTGAFRVGKV